MISSFSSLFTLISVSAIATVILSSTSCSEKNGEGLGGVLGPKTPAEVTGETVLSSGNEEDTASEASTTFDTSVSTTSNITSGAADVVSIKDEVLGGEVDDESLRGDTVFSGIERLLQEVLQ